jgi:hypothetical protein
LKLLYRIAYFSGLLKKHVKLQISELILIMTLFYGVLDVEENYYADYILYVPSEKQLLPHLPHSLTFGGNQHLPYTPHSCAQWRGISLL